MMKVRKILLSFIILLVVLVVVSCTVKQSGSNLPQPPPKTDLEKILGSIKISENIAYIPFNYGYEYPERLDKYYSIDNPNTQDLLVEILGEFQKRNGVQIISWSARVQENNIVFGIYITFFKPAEKQGGGTINGEK